MSAKAKQEEQFTGRRYVGTHETIAYIMNDFSNAFNINAYTNRFIWDVVGIDFKISAFIGIFTGIWDVINDSFFAVIVDRTRTRWGKFRPYIISFQIPLTLLATLYWLMPFLFPATNPTYLPKLIYYFTLGVVRETAGTFTSIAKTGYMSTSTPSPGERARLLMLANLITGYLGEDLPSILMSIFYDLINNGTLRWRFDKLFLFMGVGTGVVSCALSLWYFLVSRERVMQSIEKPSLKQGLKAIINNYPVLLMTLSSLLGSFSVSTDKSTYMIDVLGSASLDLIINAPSGMVGTISYAFVPWLRRRFSTKSMWVFSDLYGRVRWTIVFLLGLYKKNYKNRVFMGIVLGIEAFFGKLTFGLNNVILADMQNEVMDYCEWKNGYRVEATTEAAKNLILKLQGVFMGSVRSLIYDNIGYTQMRAIGTQTEKTKFWLFAMCTIVPQLTGILSVIPKFLYPINAKMRNTMYLQLNERRMEIAKRVSSASEEELSVLSKKQLEGGLIP
ncbi:MAG TPA: MFS transporter [Clostridiales bacterium]|nr:MFS transporter [Clostridiales bacterium]